MNAVTYLSRALVLAASLVMSGCTGPGNPSVIPNPDRNLRRSSAQFAADAAKRHPYEADAPRGGQARARAQVGYMLDLLEVVNLSEEDWNDVEVWVNQKYVVHVPAMQKGVLKKFNFQMIYDEEGNYIPTSRYRITKVELMQDGKLYDVPVQLAD